MRIYIISGICLLGAMCFSSAIKAQDLSSANHTISIAVPEVAIVDIEPSATNSLTMGFTAPTEAGLPIAAPDDDNSLWLNYSSIVASGAKNKISVNIDELIPGVAIKLTAAAAAASGGGTLGTPNSQLTLGTDDQDLVTNIESGYTGDGSSSGHNLTYNVSVASYAALVAADGATNNVTVTYTIGAQ